MPEAEPTRRWTRFLPIAAIVLALAAAQYFHVGDLISIESLRAQESALNAFVSTNLLAALALYALAYAFGICTLLPLSIPMTLASGYLFGLWPGLAASWCGAMLGATAVYFATRTALGDVLRRQAGPWLKHFEEGFQKNALNYLLALRLTPLTPFWLINLVAPLLEVKLRDYLIGTGIGIVPVWFVIVSVGAALHDAFAAGVSPDPGAALRSALVSPLTLAALAGMLTLALAPVLLKRLSPRP